MGCRGEEDRPEVGSWILGKKAILTRTRHGKGGKQEGLMLRHEEMRTIGKADILRQRWGNLARPVEVLNAVDLAGGIHCERNAIKSTVAHHTGEAARVVGLPHGPKDPVQDGLRACGALLQGGLLGRRAGRLGSGEDHGSPTGILPLHLSVSSPVCDLVKGGFEQI